MAFDAPLEPQSRLEILRDHIAGLRPDQFNMADWDLCICGHARKLFGARLGAGAKPYEGAQVLGLSSYDANLMFSGGSGRVEPCVAARMLDHYIKAGVVDWDYAKTADGLLAARFTPARAPRDELQYA
jgi:hypothetical protein